MKRIILSAIILAAASLCRAQEPLAYTAIDESEVCLCNFKMDHRNFVYIFNGLSLHGWRGYGMQSVPSRWEAQDGTIHLRPASEGGTGGDIIFAHQFQNFELRLEWKVSRGGNSGIFYLAREVQDLDGQLQPLCASAPEYQVLDNDNHPDAKLGNDGNRQSASLYDMIPAAPQNQKRHNKWNKAIIRVKDGHVEHWQNGKRVLAYRLWTPEWQQLLQNSKFAEHSWPMAYQLLLNCGGEFHQGYIGLQDHGDEVWFRNIKIRRI